MTQKIVILYGTEHHTCQNLATRLKENLLKNFKAEIQVEEFDKIKFPDDKNKWDCFIGIIPTYEVGHEGRPPADTSKFWSFLHSEQPKNVLEGVKFCLVGLGDPKYKENYQVAARETKKKLQDLGATVLHYEEIDTSKDVEVGFKKLEEQICTPLKERASIATK